jgi:hypothetical protein
MTATTYELITESNGTLALKCLLCRGESAGAEDVQRLYCTHCAWFHEPVDETRLNMLRHIETALGEDQSQGGIATGLSPGQVARAPFPERGFEAGFGEVVRQGNGGVKPPSG